MAHSSKHGRDAQQQNRMSLRNETELPTCDDPWLAEVSHTCHYCAKIVVNFQFRDDREPGTIHIKYGRVSYARRAAAKGCKLFQHIFNKSGRDSIDKKDYIGFNFSTGSQDGFDLILCAVEHGSNRRGSAWDGNILEMWSIPVSPGRSSRTQRKVSSLLMRDLGDPAASFVTTPAPNLDVNSIRAFEFAKQCLKDCESHQGCQPLTPANGGPLRLIEIGRGNEQARLIENFHQISRYAALSYCWGGDQDYKTTSSNIMSNQQQLDLPKTAKTIHDAISVTKKLGLKYLWVDALCIIQDEREDMNAELARMPDI